MAFRIKTSLPVTTLSVGKAWDGARGHYDTTRSQIDRIVLHSIAGNIQGATSVFTNDNFNTSCHYGVGLDGKKYQWVSESATAYHAGVYAYNQRSIGIEHEDNNKGDQPRTEDLYKSSAELVADICTFYNIPIDREHIVTHNEVFELSNAGKTTQCPTKLDVTRIVRDAQRIVDGDTPTYMPNVEAGVYEALVMDSRNALEIGRYLSFSDKEIKQAEFYKKAIAEIEKRINSNVREVLVVPPEKIHLGSTGEVVSSNGKDYGVVKDPEKAKSLLASISESIAEFTKMLKLL